MRATQAVGAARPILRIASAPGRTRGHRLHRAAHHSRTGAHDAGRAEEYRRIRPQRMYGRQRLLVRRVTQQLLYGAGGGCAGAQALVRHREGLPQRPHAGGEQVLRAGAVDTARRTSTLLHQPEARCHVGWDVVASAEGAPGWHVCRVRHRVVIAYHASGLPERRGLGEAFLQARAWESGSAGQAGAAGKASHGVHRRSSVLRPFGAGGEASHGVR
mmetsp:Transcript_64724/g.107276  ORF Transcript_64724/g.107276 Transcript_64724/m.107276 type:complete len:216 (-) Transcript_64724:1365-2012(-)